MKPVPLALPARDLGRPRLREFGDALIRRLESIEKRLAEKEPNRAGVPPVILTAERTLLDRLDSQTGDAVTLERQRVLHRALDEAYFRIPMPPGEGVLDGAATTLNTTLFTYEDFPAAAGSTRRRTLGMRALWARTRVRFNLFYTSPVALVTNFTLAIEVRQIDTGLSIAGGASQVFTQTFTVPGPAVINTVVAATYAVATPLVRPLPRVCQFSVGRVAPDANPNAFRYIYGEFVLEEVA